MKLFGVDVGGTFTDVIYNDTEKRMTAIHKVPTTLDDPSTGVVKGMLELCERLKCVSVQLERVTS
ncbi:MULTISPECIES: hydantoinase/oxoprolinase N-terminal domain-containing protein [Neobacillus]|jgi:N-methylhydantoinase A|uniref:hydantoinase/oxoprolinase N-terminal domain-containing protein n=1 Tax=Neobacillus TaxID=2675232 RepID=UPI002FFDC710